MKVMRLCCHMWDCWGRSFRVLTWSWAISQRPKCTKNSQHFRSRRLSMKFMFSPPLALNLNEDTKATRRRRRQKLIQHFRHSASEAPKNLLFHNFLAILSLVTWVAWRDSLPKHEFASHRAIKSQACVFYLLIFMRHPSKGQILCS